VLQPSMGLIDTSHTPLLLLLGLAVVGGAFGARLFQRLRIPQVVGYIAIGILVGKSGMRLIVDEHIAAFSPVTFFALGVIGFLIGSEMSGEVLRKHGKKFFAIMFCEGMGAFVGVSFATWAVTYALTGQAATSAAMGLLLGAMSAATAPAATVDVLWEYKTLGPLTTTILGIVALDDALALFLFSIVSSVVVRWLGGSGSSLSAGLLHAAYEMGGAAVLGGLAGLALNAIIRRTSDAEQSFTYLVGMLALLLGLSLLLEADVIFAAMVAGVVLVNLAPRQIRPARETLERFAQPIFIVFFVMVGAKLSVRSMPYWLWAVAAAYLAGRTGGKFAGSWLGAKASGAADVVRKYLGLCLFSQAGVAIGLSIVAGTRLADVSINGDSLGNIILSTIAATTFVVQLIGPSCVKLAVARAGEVGRNVTEEDLLQSYRVEDVFDPSVSAFPQDTPVEQVIRATAEDDAAAHMVVDGEGRVVGTIPLEVLKRFWEDAEASRWLVAYDIMASAPESVKGDTPLTEAIAMMNRQDIDCLPVTDAQGRYLGLLERRSINRTIRQEVLRRRNAAQA